MINSVTGDAGVIRFFYCWLTVDTSVPVLNPCLSSAFVGKMAARIVRAVADTGLECFHVALDSIGTERHRTHSRRRKAVGDGASVATLPESCPVELLRRLLR